MFNKGEIVFSLLGQAGCRGRHRDFPDAFSPIPPHSESRYHVIIMLRGFAKTKEINACVSEINT